MRISWSGGEEGEGEGEGRLERVEWWVRDVEEREGTSRVRIRRISIATESARAASRQHPKSSSILG